MGDFEIRKNMTSNKIGCIVVLFNPDDSVLDRIRHYPMEISPVLLVDNSSYDNSELFVNTERNDIFYYALYENTGIAHALNFGILKIQEKVDFVITMDQDSRLSQNVVDVYCDVIKKFDNEKVFSPNYDTERSKSKEKLGYDRVDLSMQSGMLFDISVFKIVGFFQEELFIDVVDYEFCLRLKKSGIDIIRCNEAILKHKPAETKKKRFLFFTLMYGVASPLRYYYQARNLLWTALRYRSIKLYLILIIKLLKILFLFNNKKEYLYHFFVGVNDAYHNKLGRKDSIK